MKKALMGISVAMLLAACGMTSTNGTNTTNATAQTPQTTQQAHVEVKTDGTYTVKEYDFESNGKNLYARAFVPDVEGRVPLVIFSHGLGPTPGTRKKCRRHWRRPALQSSAWNLQEDRLRLLR